ncbi:MAG: glucokinase [Chloroflexi bacterium]|nr:MAG: glucokinase [Chloroflexota bacterium]
MSDELAIGIDVGATKIAAALVTRQGAVLAEERLATAPKAGAEAVVERIVTAIDRLAAGAPAAVCGVGIGTPGYVDPANGVVRNAVNLGWQEVALASQVQERLAAPLPVWVDNDANVQALGEVSFGAGRGLDPVVCVTIGSGLGSGIVVNGRLVSGATHSAAEMGHLSLDPDGRPCACGLRGCVETVVSGPGLVTTARELLARDYHHTLMTNPAALSAEEVVAAARREDSVALEALEYTARWLGIAFAALVAVLNPAAIVVGGGLGHSAYDWLAPGAQAELARRVVHPSYAQLQIVPSQVMSSAVGAASLVWQARG